MEEKIIKKLSDIEKAIDNVSIDLGVDLVDSTSCLGFGVGVKGIE